MKQEITDKVFAYIDALAKKLGVAVEYVFGIFVRQQIVEGIVEIVIGIIGMVAILLFLKWVYKQYEKNKGDYLSDWSFGFVISLIVGIGGIVGILVLISDGIMQIGNPQYYALKEILDSLGGR